VGEGGQAGGALGADSFGEIEDSAPGGVQAAGGSLDRAGRIEADEYGGGHSTGLLCGVMRGGCGKQADGGAGWWREADARPSTSFFWRHYRRGGGLYEEFKRSTFFSIEGQEEAERTRAGSAPVEPRKHVVSAVTGGNVDLLA